VQEVCWFWLVGGITDVQGRRLANGETLASHWTGWGPAGVDLKAGVRRDFLVTLQFRLQIKCVSASVLRNGIVTVRSDPSGFGNTSDLIASVIVLTALPATLNIAFRRCGWL